MVDEVFKGTGHKSLIPYQKLFSTYKRIIMTKLAIQEKDSEFEEMINGTTHRFLIGLIPTTRMMFRAAAVSTR